MSPLGRAAKFVLRMLGLLILGWISVAVAFLWTDHVRILKACERILVGMPVSEVEAMIEVLDRKTRVVRFTRQDGTHVIELIDPATVGDRACTIAHDGKTVTQAQYR